MFYSKPPTIEGCVEQRFCTLSYTSLCSAAVCPTKITFYPHSKAHDGVRLWINNHFDCTWKQNSKLTQIKKCVLMTYPGGFQEVKRHVNDFIIEQISSLV